MIETAHMIEGVAGQSIKGVLGSHADAYFIGILIKLPVYKHIANQYL